MALPTPGSDDAERRRAVIQRHLVTLKSDNTPESLAAASGATAAAAVAPPSFAGGGTIAGAVDQQQRTGERSRFVPTAAQQAEMDRSIAASASQNAALKTSTDPFAAIKTTLSRGNVDLANNPLGIGATPASLGATGSAAVQRATGTAPNSPEVQRQLGSASLSDEGQALLGARTAPTTSLPTSRPGTTLPTPIDSAQRAGERSSAPAYDMDALRAEAAKRAADANAVNAANSGTTTTGGVRPPGQPPVIPPTTTTRPPVDTMDTTGLFDKMFQGINNQKTLTADGAGAGAGGAGAGGAGSTSLPGGGAPGSATSSAQLQQTLLSDLAGIREQISRGPQAPDVMATFMTMGKSILDMLDQQIADLQAEGSTIDPMTQNTLDRLREELGTQLKATKEALNARGLLDSGILVEAEQMLRKGSLSDASRILAERLSRLQQSVQSLRGQKVSTANEWGMAGAQAQTQAEMAERNRIESLRGMSLSTQASLAGQYQQSELAAQRQAFDAEQSATQRQFSAEQAELDRQYGEAQFYAKTAAEFEQNRQQYEYESALIAQRDGGGSSGTARSTSRTANGAAPQDNTRDAINDMFDTFATRREAEAALSNPALLRELQENGVDIGQVIEAAQGLGERRIGTQDY